MITKMVLALFSLRITHKEQWEEKGGYFSYFILNVPV